MLASIEPADDQVTMGSVQRIPISDGPYTSSTTFDALNRPLTVTSPDGSVYRPTFNQANLLNEVAVEIRGAGVATSFVTNIDYNAKGQREKIDYENGATTTYEYEPLTFRLSRLTTTRPARADATASQLFKDASVVQDLRYSYDPVGNITRIEDAALKSIMRNGQDIVVGGAYRYDAIYRLVEAKGREHIGQNVLEFNPPNGDYGDHPFAGHRAHGNDLQALRNYTERYEYDSVGNFVEFAHRANGAGWTRRYEYQENSLIETGKKSNRLTKTTVGNGLNQVEPYTHDAHGNMTSMPHLAAIIWSSRDELQQADLGGGGTAYYLYDGAGQRVRKVIESQNGARQKERLYLGGFEIYREYDGAEISLERESLDVLDDKQRIALVETQTIQNGNAVKDPVPLQRYQLGSHLGSSSVELDKDGVQITYEEHHPYGTTSFQVGGGAAEVSLKRYRYTGKERDEETGFYYHGARYYACWLGRWTSADPSGFVDGTNLYAYVRCAPILASDPAGRERKIHGETTGWYLDRGTGARVPLGSAPQPVGLVISSSQIKVSLAPVVATPELNGPWPYSEAVQNRAALGSRVERHHTTWTATRELQRTAPDGTKFHDRAISRAAGEQTLLVETGRGKPHTELGRVGQAIHKAVKSGDTTYNSESTHLDRVQLSVDALNSSIGRKLITDQAVDETLLSGQATLHGRLADTVEEFHQKVGAVSGEPDLDFEAGFVAKQGFLGPSKTNPWFSNMATAAGRSLTRGLVPFVAEFEDTLSQFGDPYKVSTYATAAAVARSQGAAASTGIRAVAVGAAESVSTFLIGVGSRLSTTMAVVPTNLLRSMAGGGPET